MTPWPVFTDIVSLCRRQLTPHLPGLPNSSGLWPALLVIGWGYLLGGLAPLGHWAVLWTGLSLLWALNHTLVYRPLVLYVIDSLSSYGEEALPSTLGQVLACQWLALGVIASLTALIGWLGLHLHGWLLVNVILLAISIPYLHLLLGLFHATRHHQQKIYANQRLLSIGLVTQVVGLVILHLLGDHTMAHLAGVIALSTLVTASVGTLSLGFIQFEWEGILPPPIPSANTWLTTIGRAIGWPMTGWLNTEGMILLTAVTLGPISAGLLWLCWRWSHGFIAKFQPPTNTPPEPLPLSEVLLTTSGFLLVSLGGLWGAGHFAGLFQGLHQPSVLQYVGGLLVLASLGRLAQQRCPLVNAPNLPQAWMMRGLSIGLILSLVPHIKLLGVALGWWLPDIALWLWHATQQHQSSPLQQRLS